MSIRLVHRLVLPLMTGRYSDRVGVWHTVQGRNMLRKREVTMADVFKSNGYATGMFGKWHLGDCYPYRPEDRGFQHCVYHKAGGVGQAPDYWGNDYFDDTYVVNGKFQQFKGFCTDIWFDEGMKFIKDSKAKDKPFFAYIATNAPHSPYYSPEKYSKPYAGNPDVSIPEFYGMITNIDDNMAKLMKMLDDEGLADNTILVFMTDNGTAGGLKGGRGYDGGMRGMKEFGIRRRTSSAFHDSLAKRKNRSWEVSRAFDGSHRCFADLHQNVQP